MSRNYKFHNSEGIYFVSFAVVEWIDVFVRKEYKDILLKNLAYCQKEKGMEIYAWCIMGNHMHFIFRSTQGIKPETLLGYFKRFTSRILVKAICSNSHESRKDWLLAQFKKAAEQSSNVKNYQFWQHDNNPIELWSKKVLDEKLNYVHHNPVKQGLVSKPEDYLYSSARDYSGEIGLLNGIVLVR